MPDVSISKIVYHRFCVDKNGSEPGIFYYMIISNDLVLQIGLSTDFNHKFLQWDGAKVPMKEPSGLLGQTDSTSCEMREVVV